MARVVLAMSGGVDSSAAALLLREQGHEACTEPESDDQVRHDSRSHPRGDLRDPGDAAGPAEPEHGRHADRGAARVT